MVVTPVVKSLQLLQVCMFFSLLFFVYHVCQPRKYPKRRYLTKVVDNGECLGQNTQTMYLQWHSSVHDLPHASANAPAPIANATRCGRRPAPAMQMHSNQMQMHPSRNSTTCHKAPARPGAPGSSADADADGDADADADAEADSTILL